MGRAAMETANVGRAADAQLSKISRPWLESDSFAPTKQAFHVAGKLSVGLSRIETGSNDGIAGSHVSVVREDRADTPGGAAAIPQLLGRSCGRANAQRSQRHIVRRWGSERFLHPELGGG